MVLDVEHGDDVGVVEAGHGDRLAEQPLHQLLALLALELGVEADRLERHRPLELGVPAAKDRAHGARADDVGDLVAAEEDLVEPLLLGDPALQRLEGGAQLADLVAGAARRGQTGEAALGGRQLADRPHH